MGDLPIGVPFKRSVVHDHYGGITQGGISPSRKTPNVLLFTNPSQGEKYGYTDGWGADGLFYYTGQGRVGPQTMTGNNAAVLRHLEDGRRLQLFRSVEKRSHVERVGEFVLDDQNPWFSVDGPDEKGNIRRLIIFRLRPVGETLHHNDVPAPAPSSHVPFEFAPLERHTTERMTVEPQRAPYEAERREAKLVMRYHRHLEAMGHDVRRHRIIPKGENNPLYTDLHDVTDNVLVESKGNVTREAIRMAIGQLFDYRRYIDPEPRLAILVPERPRDDLRDLCAATNIATIWPSGRSFTVHEPRSAAN